VASLSFFVAHRGRLQAQGADLGNDEVSWAWAQRFPFRAKTAHWRLRGVSLKLTDKQQRRRERAFAQAHNFIDVCRVNGGIDAPVSQSFPQPKLQGGIRVDIEVHKGKAFT
jgi:hypothetical protein